MLPQELWTELLWYLTLSTLRKLLHLCQGSRASIIADPRTLALELLINGQSIVSTKITRYPKCFQPWLHGVTQGFIIGEKLKFAPFIVYKEIYSRQLKHTTVFHCDTKEQLILLYPLIKIHDRCAVAYKEWLLRKKGNQLILNKWRPDEFQYIINSFWTYEDFDLNTI